MTIDPNEKRFRRLNTQEKRNIALRTALNNLVGAEQRRASDPALFEERYAWAERLLQAGADPVQPTSSAGLTLLHWAFQCRCVSMARLLIEHGADPAQKDLQSHPRSALDHVQAMAAEPMHLPVIDTFLDLFEKEAPIVLERIALRETMEASNTPLLPGETAKPRRRL